MLTREQVEKYLGQATLWELMEHLKGKPSDDLVEIYADRLYSLAEQALYPAWFHGYLGPDGMIVVLEPRNPDGPPELGAVSMDDDGMHVDVYYCHTKESMLEMLEDVESGKLIPPTTVVEFVMSNSTLMKGLRWWIKQRKERNEQPT